MSFWQQDTFQQYYRCYPISAMKGDKSEANYGGKIFVPASALQKLTMLHISYPMLFEIRNEDTQARTHAGVLEFTAEEGRAYLPEWMMQVLGAHPGSLVRIASVALELASFVKIQPQSVDFLDISDPKAVLETALRNFTTLTVNDVFQIKYNDHIYGIKVLEVKPETDREGVCVVETDLEVDFAAPLGYVEPSVASSSASSVASRKATPKVTGEMAKAINYSGVAKPQQFSQGQSLRGKPVPTEPVPVEAVDASIYENRDAPALELPANQLFFGFPVVPFDEDEEEQLPAFTGEGNTLRKSKKRKEPHE